jgi:hypothetical protein
MSGTFTTSCPEFLEGGAKNPCFGDKPTGSWSEVTGAGGGAGEGDTASASFQYEDCPGLTEGQSGPDVSIEVFLQKCDPNSN